jgi:glutamyl-tRNA reductase
VISEASVLSTCNRFEVYFAAQDSYAAFHEAMRFLEKHSGLPQSVLRRNLFLLSGEDCIWHLLRVSGGLDSLVVGEGQILSQVRRFTSHRECRVVVLSASNNRVSLSGWCMNTGEAVLHPWD